MKLRKIAAVLATGVITASTIVAPLVSAAEVRKSYYTIDYETYDNKGTITLYKLIENDGLNKVGDGYEHAEDNARTKSKGETDTAGQPLDNVEFTYLKIADFISVNGRENNKSGGNYVSGSYSDTSQVGIYFNNIDAGFKSRAKIAGCDMDDSANKTVIEDNVYYTTVQMEAALRAINAYAGNPGSTPESGETGETNLNKYLSDLYPSKSTPSVYSATQGYSKTDSNGRIKFGTESAGLSLGLYLIGETDISAHDGIDASGKRYEQSKNPEAPVIESLASPFLVSLPMTNIAKEDGHEAGEVWLYDITVYPKDSQTSIYKRIVDVDEKGDRTLRLSEDYQIGDVIEQVIYSDAPKLQSTPAATGSGTLPNVTHKKYVITDTMTNSLTFDKVTKVTYGPKVANPKFDTDFSAFQTMTANTDYTVTPSADLHSFKVTLTDAGLAKLDAAPSFYQVAVWFESTLNNEAKIGTVPVNENYPTLNWRNSNGVEHEIKGNHTKVYTYELDLTKKGLNDSSLSTFTVVRHDTVKNKTVDKTDAAVTSVTDNARDSIYTAENLCNGQVEYNDVDVEFIKESDGVYHVFDRNSNATHYDVDASKATKLLIPAAGENGKLIIKGLDSQRYTFTEIKTEGKYYGGTQPGNSDTEAINAMNDIANNHARDLLKTTFDVIFRAPDPVRDGNLLPNSGNPGTYGAAVKTPDINTETKLSHADGIAKITVNNYKTITLRTGGAGRTIIYVTGAALLTLLMAIVIFRKKKGTPPTV